MQCKGCGYPHTQVAYTEQYDKDTLRRRQCMRCGLRFTTLEKIKEQKKLLKQQDKKEING